MPTTKMSSSASAPTAPHQAVSGSTSATATAISAKGKSSPKKSASLFGTPKSRIACRDPGRSASLARPATRNTAHNSSRAKRSSRVILALFYRFPVTARKQAEESYSRFFSGWNSRLRRNHLRFASGRNDQAQLHTPLLQWPALQQVVPPQQGLPKPQHSEP